MKNLLTITDKDISSSEKISSAKPRIAVGTVLEEALQMTENGFPQ